MNIGPWSITSGREERKNGVDTPVRVDCRIQRDSGVWTTVTRGSVTHKTVFDSNFDHGTSLTKQESLQHPDSRSRKRPR